MRIAVSQEPPRRLSLQDVQAAASAYPPGWMEAVMALGVVDGGEVVFTGEAFAELVRRYGRATAAAPPNRCAGCGA
jgi:hypothetical protein